MVTPNQIINADNVETLRGFPDDCIDSIVTDPPYGLSFMGKRWDYDVPSVELWQECLRVLKPGGHLLAFAGTRTQHRMAVRIEDAGFEIRDMIAWVYGSGFPKSLDVSKAIDKAAGAELEQRWKPVTARSSVGTLEPRPWLDEARKNGGCFIDGEAPSTEAAKQWQGWGTALKPALEPITVARKPLSGTVAENVLQHGTGAVNVDGCRVDYNGETPSGWFNETERKNAGFKLTAGSSSKITSTPSTGRWPANLIHDGSDEVTDLFPETSPAKAAQRGAAINGAIFKSPEYASTVRGHDDAGGSAARFFYCAKADGAERRNSRHPTVKPVALMRYLVRLVTPVGGIVLDPFGGSGTTAEAARLESCRYILIEREAEYCRDAAERLRQGVLF